MQYINDYDEVYPDSCYMLAGSASASGPALGFLLDPYIKSANVWRCPSDSLNNLPVYTSGTNTSTNYPNYKDVSYGYNSVFFCPLSGSSPSLISHPMNAAKLNTPANDVIVDGAWGTGPNSSNTNTITWMFDTLYLSIPTNYNSPACRMEGSPQAPQPTGTGHNGGGNFIYADGHAKWSSSGYIGAQLALWQSNTYPNMFGETNVIPL